MRRFGARVGMILGGVVATTLGGCASTTVPTAHTPGPESHFRFVPATTGGDPVGWVVLLPGSSGLEIFGDTTHYSDAADRFAAMGFDAVIVDYKPAYRAADRSERPATSVSTGEKIAWVTEQAIGWAHAQGGLADDTRGAIVAWSLGAEGMWRLVADADRARDLGIAAAAAYYPVIDEAPEGPPVVPILLLAGEDDDVTRPRPIKELVSSYERQGGDVQVRVYPNANHGFDVRSITEARTVRLLPLIGPKATFAYDAEAESEARRELGEFLRGKLAGE